MLVSEREKKMERVDRENDIQREVLSSLTRNTCVFVSAREAERDGERQRDRDGDR